MKSAAGILPLLLLCRLAAAVTLDVSGIRPGPVTVTSTATSATVHWNDEADRPWTAEFSLEPRAPLITAIAAGGARVIERARPFYQCTTGKRRGGWGCLFHFPPHPSRRPRHIPGEIQSQIRPAVAHAKPARHSFR